MGESVINCKSYQIWRILHQEKGKCHQFQIFYQLQHPYLIWRIQLSDPHSRPFILDPFSVFFKAASTNTTQLTGDIQSISFLTMSADDNEFDFVNPEEEEAHLNNAEEEEEQQGERGGGRRGPDIAWREVDRYIILGGGLNDPQLPKTREVFVSRQFWVHFLGG